MTTLKELGSKFKSKNRSKMSRCKINWPFIWSVRKITSDKNNNSLWKHSSKESKGIERSKCLIDSLILKDSSRETKTCSKTSSKSRLLSREEPNNSWNLLLEREKKNRRKKLFKRWTREPIILRPIPSCLELRTILEVPWLLSSTRLPSSQCMIIITANLETLAIITCHLLSIHWEPRKLTEAAMVVTEPMEWTILFKRESLELKIPRIWSKSSSRWRNKDCRQRRIRHPPQIRDLTTQTKRQWHCRRSDHPSIFDYDNDFNLIERVDRIA